MTMTIQNGRDGQEVVFRCGVDCVQKRRRVTDKDVDFELSDGWSRVVAIVDRCSAEVLVDHLMEELGLKKKAVSNQEDMTSIMKMRIEDRNAEIGRLQKEVYSTRAELTLTKRLLDAARGLEDPNGSGLCYCCKQMLEENKLLKKELELWKDRESGEKKCPLS